MGARGLELTKNDAIVMERESLHITPDKITVSYTFFNPTDKAQRLLVAFPLPDIDASDIETSINAVRGALEPGTNDVGGFSVRVNGKRLQHQTERKAWLRGKDVTKLLTELKLPLIPWVDPRGYEAALRHLSTIDKHSLVANGLVAPNSLEAETTNAGNGPEWTPTFLYVVKIRHHWTQAFPSKKRTRVTHSYRPLRGAFFGPTSDKTSWKTEARSLDEQGLCGSASDFFRSKPPAKGVGPCAAVKTIGYILTTASNWRGAIGHFSLKLSKMPYVFTCFKGLKRTGKTTWEFSAKNFVPTANLFLGACEHEN